MKPIKRILLPTDFSEGAEAAYAIAHKLALKFGAQIDIIHIAPSIRYYVRFLETDREKEYTELMISEAREKVAGAMSDFDEEVRGEYFVQTDRKPSDALMEHLRKKPYDLVVMGSTGSHQTKMKRGGTTRHTIRRSPVPVLSVEKGMTIEGIKEILVPTDGSDLSFTAINKAAVFAEAFDADITLLYVVVTNVGLAETAYYTPEQILDDDVYLNVMSRLTRFLKNREKGGIQLERKDKLFEDTLMVQADEKMRPIHLKTKIKTGFAAHYSIESYAEKNSDLVVMATHGYGGFAHMFLGSVAEKVIQHIKKPVLTVRPSEAEFAKSKEKDFVN